MGSGNQAIKGTLELECRFNASPYSDQHEMAYLYCVDERTRYVFSLSRRPESQLIEVMVMDQQNEKVEDLDVVLTGDVLDARFDDDLARRLDGYKHYRVSLDIETPEQRQRLHETLRKIFWGKTGGTIVASD